MLYEVKEKIHFVTTSHLTDKTKRVERNSHIFAKGGSYLKKKRNGDWITGYNVDKDLATDVKKLLEQEKKEIESFLNIKIDEKDPDNEFLLNCRIDLYLPNGETVIYDEDHPLDCFKIKAAIAGGLIAPSLEEVRTGIYANTDFYFLSKEKESQKKKKSRDVKFSIQEVINKKRNNAEWLIIMAWSFDYQVRPESLPSTLLDFLNEKLEETTALKDLEKFESKIRVPNEELLIKFITKKAVETKTIAYDVSTKTYHFEGLALGKTYEEIQNNFKGQYEESFNTLYKKIISRYNVN